MYEIPKQLTVGEGDSTMPYELAEDQHLVRLNAPLKVAESFDFLDVFDANAVPEVKAARETLDSAGLAWVQTLPGVAENTARESLGSSPQVEEYFPIYYAKGSGPESAATPVTDTINVRLSHGSNDTITRLEALGLKHNPIFSRLLAPLHVFKVVGSEHTRIESSIELLKRVQDEGVVKSAEFDWLKLETYLTPPNDQKLGLQWNLATIGLSRALQLATGSADVWIAIIDSGFDLGHPDLYFTPNAGEDFTHFNAEQAEAGAFAPYDAGSAGVAHGTAVAGIAAARTNNAQGVAGVGGGCRVLPVRLGRSPTANKVSAGLNWARENGARVASMSLSVVATSAVNNAVTNAWNAGLVLCAATGNSGKDTTSPPIGFPATHPNVIAVGASDQDDQRKRPNSSDGIDWGSQFGPEIDLVAPGVQIWTTDERGKSGYNPGSTDVSELIGGGLEGLKHFTGDYYAEFRGTSAATPHVAGLVGLMLSAVPTLTNEQVRTILESTCEKISSDFYEYKRTAGRQNGNWNQETGYGRIDAAAAIAAALASV